MRFREERPSFVWFEPREGRKEEEEDEEEGEEEEGRKREERREVRGGHAGIRKMVNEG